MTTSSANDNRWYFSKEQLENSPSRRCGVDPEKELSQRQQAANFIQDMGQRLQVTQLCINTAIVYMHRFYCFHSFTQFHRNVIAPAAIFLAAKVEEQPRKLEHIIKVTQMLLQRNQPPLDRRSDVYMEQAQELVIIENILLMTLGFDVAIEHPHTFIVNFCHLVKASKDLSQTSYFMATNSLHLTTMCLQYKPAVVACFCIHLVCRWSNCQIPNSNENLPWHAYIDQTVTVELLEQLTNEFLIIFDKCPSRLKKRIQNSQVSCQNSLSGYTFDVDTRTRQSSSDPNTSSSSGFSQHDNHHQNHRHHHQSQRVTDNQQLPNKSTSHAVDLKKNSMAPLPSNKHSASINRFTALNGHDATKLPITSSVITPQQVASRTVHQLQLQSKQSVNAYSSHLQQHKMNNTHIQSVSRPPRPTFGLGGQNAEHKEPILRLEHLKKVPMEMKQEIVASGRQDPGVMLPKEEPGLMLAPNAVTLPPSMNNLRNGSTKSGGIVLQNTMPPIKKENGIQDVGSRGFVSTSHSDIICNVVKEVALAKQFEKQRLVKTEPEEAVVTESAVPITTASIKVPMKSHSIFSPSPVGSGEIFEDRMLSGDVSMKFDSKEAAFTEGRARTSSSSSEAELIPIVKKVETVSGFENIFKLHEAREKMVSLAIDHVDGPIVSSDPMKLAVTSSSMSTTDSVVIVKDDSSLHSHKKKKKHKEKDKKHDKEKRHHHKEKKKHKEDKYKKEHREKESLRPPEHIKITIPKEKLGDIPLKKEIPISAASLTSVTVSVPHEVPSVKGDAAPVKLKIKIPKERHLISKDQLLSCSSVPECKLKISKDKLKSRKRNPDNDHDEVSKKCAHYEDVDRNGY